MEASNLTHDLLASDPQQYLNILFHCKNNQIDVSEQLNSKEYETYYSNHLTCLSYLVGDLRNLDVSAYDFYGSQSCITNDLGIEIMHFLINLGVDVSDKNYYGQTVFDCIKEEQSLTSRKNNDDFKKAILNLIRCSYP